MFCKRRNFLVTIIKTEFLIAKSHNTIVWLERSANAVFFLKRFILNFFKRGVL